MAAISFGLSPTLVERMVRDNDHNKYTTLYHLLITRRERGDLVIEKQPKENEKIVKVNDKKIVEKPIQEKKKDLLIQIEDVQANNTPIDSRSSNEGRQQLKNKFPDLVSPQVKTYNQRVSQEKNKRPSISSILGRPKNG